MHLLEVRLGSGTKTQLVLKLWNLHLWMRLCRSLLQLCHITSLRLICLVHTCPDYTYLWLHLLIMQNMGWTSLLPRKGWKCCSLKYCIVFLCVIPLYRVTCSCFMYRYYESVSRKPSSCCEHSLQQQMYLKPQMKLVANKRTINSSLSYYCG